jgi:hypothetical protein
MKILPVHDHQGVNYALISREEAIMIPDFPKALRLKLSASPSAKFVIMQAIEECDEERKFICEIEQ